MRGRRVVATRAFEACLEGVRAFLGDTGASRFDALVAELFEVVALLGHHPGVGRLFTAHAAQSAEGEELLSRIVARLGGREVREYVLRDHVLLYVVAPKAVYLLAIRHHRQLSVDFARLWR